MFENKAQILQPTDDNIKLCAEKILKGEVVGMPTETVYGLAANAFNLQACLKIFEYKNRPLTDPLIVHVCSLEMAKQITILDENCEELFKILSKKFWPGPLTIILKANLNKIDTKILANHDAVGLRFPVHPIAKKFIEACGVPIAAPSANKFCHISPVKAMHVYEDFKEFDIKILDGGECNFCMESTVIKLYTDEKKILVCRMGAVSMNDIKKELEKHERFKDFEIESLAKKNNQIDTETLKQIHKQLDNNNTDKNKNNKINMKNNNDQFTINQDAPGQFLKHYSPKLQTFLYSGEIDEYFQEIKISEKILFIDYMNILYNKFGSKVKAENFMELSKEGNPSEVMKNFYNYLHKAEMVENKEYIVICDLEKYMSENEHKLTLLDRMLKAASFRKIKLIE